MRNSVSTFPNRVSLMTEKSMLNCPGPRTVLRPVLPKVAVVSVTRAKAAVLNHMSIVGLSRVGSPIVSGRLFVMPVDSIVPDCVIVSGSPDRR